MVVSFHLSSKKNIQLTRNEIVDCPKTKCPKTKCPKTKCPKTSFVRKGAKYEIVTKSVWRHLCMTRIIIRKNLDLEWRWNSVLCNWIGRRQQFEERASRRHLQPFHFRNERHFRIKTRTDFPSFVSPCQLLRLTPQTNLRKSSLICLCPPHHHHRSERKKGNKEFISGWFSLSLWG